MPTFINNQQEAVSYFSLHTSNLLRVYLVLFVLLVSHFIYVPRTVASTDPISATVSATATVPTTTPTTTDTTAPTNPILISPQDGTITSDNTPLFTWRRSTDDNSNTIIYTLYLNGVATYLGISNLGNSASHNYDAYLDGQEIKLSPNLDLPDGTYNWYVTASDLSLNTSHSATWHLTIDTTPPPIHITAIDSYTQLALHSDFPERFADLNFEITGPKNVPITVLTEPHTTLTLQFYLVDGELSAQTSIPVGPSGLAQFNQYLSPGHYRLIVSAFDQAQNTSALPEIALTIKQATITIPPPQPDGSQPPPILQVPYTPITLGSLPATIAQIESRLPLLVMTVSLLALGINALLVLLWKRRFNLVLTDRDSNPLAHATIYHSLPNTKRPTSSLLLTTKDPISYTLEPTDQGRLYVKGLSKYSTLTIRTTSSTTTNQTFVLSICTSMPRYYLTL